jgi:hypothetical protein
MTLTPPDSHNDHGNGDPSGERQPRAG